MDPLFKKKVRAIAASFDAASDCLKAASLGLLKIYGDALEALGRLAFWLCRRALGKP